MRKQDPSGVALSTFGFTLTTAATATAHYIDPAADTDGDGIPDWNEMTYYGTLGSGPNDDTDSDGLTYEMELLRGNSPRVLDTLAQGGISRRRVALTAVNAVFLPNPPAIGQNAAIDIAVHTAQLSALVNPIGSAATVYFEYGLTAYYGQQTAVQSLGSGLQALTVTEALQDLLPGVLYHFRVVASNGQGTTYAEDSVFTTALSPYPEWAAAHGVGNENADEDGDGLSNLVEYAFAQNPAAADSPAYLPTAQLIGGRIRLRVPEPAGAIGVVYGGEWSLDLRNWFPMLDAGTGSGHEFVTPDNLVDGSRIYVRGTVTTAP